MLSTCCCFCLPFRRKSTHKFEVWLSINQRALGILQHQPVALLVNTYRSRSAAACTTTPGHPHSFSFVFLLTRKISSSVTTRGVSRGTSPAWSVLHGVKCLPCAIVCVSFSCPTRLAGSSSSSPSCLSWRLNDAAVVLAAGCSE